jgi:hypothetical protein
MFVFILAFAGGLLYFLPTFIAYRKKHFVAITLVNVFLGWTIVGWIFALIWAVVDRAPQQPLSTVLDAPGSLDID